MTRYQISPIASRDLETIVDYFLEKSVDAGEQFIQDFNQKCVYLTQFPFFGRSYQDVAPELRGIPLRGYVIFYKVVDNGIVIVRVLSGYRDFKSLFGE
ncbi:MAG: type II toxin-antitoxin system RelE/ParE family toxin [Prochlorotrichaceae cyanobacterium]